MRPRMRHAPGQVTWTRTPRTSRVRSPRAPRMLIVGSRAAAPASGPAGGAATGRSARSMLSQPCWLSSATMSSVSTIATSAPTPQFTVSSSPSRARISSDPPVQGATVHSLSPAKRSRPGPPSRRSPPAEPSTASSPAPPRTIVLAGAAVDEVVAAAAVDRVVAAVAEEVLGAVVAGQGVGERRADHRLDVAVDVVALAGAAPSPGCPSMVTAIAPPRSL